MGNATDYSNELINAFESTLPVDWTDDDEPSIFPHRLELNHIQSFQNAYRDCNTGSLSDGAITDLYSYQNSNSLLQTCGVGLAEDFNHFVNLGMLIGNRVVLWDTVIFGTFFPPDGRLDRDEICKLSCEYLSLKSIIQDGGIIILPQPGIWLERCQYYISAIADIPNLTPSFAGFLNARALKDEGFFLHPYTVDGGNGTASFLDQALSIGKNNPMISNRNRKDECAINELFVDTNITYLKGIDSKTLYSILKKRNYPIGRLLWLKKYVSQTILIRTMIFEDILLR